jgi:hypothetical protein
MLCKSSFLSRFAILAVALPVAGFSAVTGINASVDGGSVTCGSGSCTAAALAATGAPITLGPTATTGSYSFNVTAADGDVYNVAGTFANTFVSGTFLGFFPTVTYEGNSGKGTNPLCLTCAVSEDTITLNMLQDFTFPGSSIKWDGTYNETIPLELPVSGSSASGQVLYSTVDGTGATVDAGGTVGELGPVFGTGDYTLTGSKNISPLDGNILASDFMFTFVFPGGTATPVGGSISSPVSLVPEPAQTIPAALGLVGLLLFRARKIRFGNAN